MRQQSTYRGFDTFRWGGLAKRGSLWGSVGAGLLALVGWGQPVMAAESIGVFWPPLFELSLPVADLELFAREGRTTRKLDFYVRRLTPDQRADLQDLLTRQFAVDGVTVSQFTYSPVGESLLRRLTPMLKSSSDDLDFHALRAAFILAATDPEGLTLVNFFRRYPTDRLRVDLRLSSQVVQEVSQLFQEADAITTAIQAIASAQLPNSGTPIAEPAPRSVPFLAVPTSPPLPDPLQVGSTPWRQETLSFRNPEREQAVQADLYLPEGDPDQSVPLIVISHGIASDRNTFAYLAEHLASHNLAVAVLEHPGTNIESFKLFLTGFNALADEQDWVKRPRDITALLDVLADQQSRDPRLGRLDLDNVGVLGQSLGGYTVLAAAGAELNSSKLLTDCTQDPTSRVSLNPALLLQCQALNLLLSDQPLLEFPSLKDERIRAVIAVNPLTSSVFGGEGLQAIEAPLMLIAGSKDFFAPAVPEQIHPFLQLTDPDHYLVLLENGTHFSFLGGGGRGVFDVPASLLGPDPAQSRVYLNALSTAFFQVYLNQATEFAPYLTPNYARRLAEDPFQLDLLKEVSPELREGIPLPP
ncbi:MAG: alpha/beta hydrolase [Cyanobacteriota bacterium]|nr:alpha/beta hydrolase [Cyanobacteriota bacterium]